MPYALSPPAVERLRSHERSPPTFCVNADGESRLQPAMQLLLHGREVQLSHAIRRRRNGHQARVSQFDCDRLSRSHFFRWRTFARSKSHPRMDELRARMLDELRPAAP